MLARQPAGMEAPPAALPTQAKRPTPQFILLFKSPDDRSPQAPLRPGRIFLENQDLGGDVERRMGKPVRWLRALLPGKARRRGYRQDLLHPRVLQASGCRPMRLQGLRKPLRQGSRLRSPDT